MSLPSTTALLTPDASSGDSSATSRASKRSLSDAFGHAADSTPTSDTPKKAKAEPDSCNPTCQPPPPAPPSEPIPTHPSTPLLNIKAELKAPAPEELILFLPPGHPPLCHAPTTYYIPREDGRAASPSDSEDSKDSDSESDSATVVNDDSESCDDACGSMATLSLDERWADSFALSTAASLVSTASVASRDELIPQPRRVPAWQLLK